MLSRFCYAHEPGGFPGLFLPELWRMLRRIPHAEVTFLLRHKKMTRQMTLFPAASDLTSLEASLESVESGDQLAVLAYFFEACDIFERPFEETA